MLPEIQAGMLANSLGLRVIGSQRWMSRRERGQRSAPVQCPLGVQRCRRVGPSGHSKIAGRANRGIVGEITKRARATHPMTL
jgi:hypothetical protein